MASYVLKLEKQIKELNVIIEKMQKEKLSCETKNAEESKIMKDENEKLKHEIVELQEKLKDSESIEKLLRKSVQEKDANINRWKSDFIDCSVLYSKSSEEVGNLKQEIEDLYETNGALMRQNRYFKRLAVEHNRLKKSFKNLESEYYKLKGLYRDQNEKFIESSREMNKHYDKLKERSKTIEDENKDLKLKCEKYEKEIRKLQEKLKMEDTENDAEERKEKTPKQEENAKKKESPKGPDKKGNEKLKIIQF